MISFAHFFKKGYEETIKYKARFGKPNAPHTYVTPEGYRLGAWQSTQRVKYKNNRISLVKFRKLKKIGFVWDPLGQAFEKGIQHSLLHKKQFGNPNAPADYVSPDGYQLRNWQNYQRYKYRNKRLTQERIRTLEKIGFLWKPKFHKRSHAFEHRYQQTLEYKKLYGDANVSRSVNSPEWYPLGAWQNNQRFNFLKNKLDPEKIQKLNKIGFRWRLRDKRKKKRKGKKH